MQNVELKRELRDMDLCRSVIRRLGAAHAATVAQRDTYFRVSDGRLKKREVEGEAPEWIFYHRQNRLTARLSHFSILTEEEALTRFGSMPLPIRVIVDKTREVWFKGNLRIHLDDVHGLGRFLEIEALVTPRNHVGNCHQQIADLVKALAPILGEAIALSYSDMLERDQGE